MLSMSNEILRKTSSLCCSIYVHLPWCWWRSALELVAVWTWGAVAAAHPVPGSSLRSGWCYLPFHSSGSTSQSHYQQAAKYRTRNCLYIFRTSIHSMVLHTEDVCTFIAYTHTQDKYTFNGFTHRGCVYIHCVYTHPGQVYIQWFYTPRMCVHSLRLHTPRTSIHSMVLHTQDKEGMKRFI